MSRDNVQRPGEMFENLAEGIIACRFHLAAGELRCVCNDVVKGTEIQIASFR